MDFPCSECAYFTKCFTLLKLFASKCQQGRRMKSQTKLSEFPEKGPV
jgi:hypothetical protein